MTNTKNVIEINGKRYDAVTGAYLGDLPRGAQPAVTRPAHHTVDGFRRASRATQTPLELLKPLPAAVAHPASKIVTAAAPQIRKPHQPAAHTNPHKPQPAKTLMRSAVKKPSVVAPSVIKAQTRTDILAKVPAQTIVPKLPHTKVNGIRERRAARVMQSPAVSKYAAQPLMTRTAHVTHPPQPAAMSVHTSAASIPVTVHKTVLKPDIAPRPTAVRSELRQPRPHFQPHTGQLQSAPARTHHAPVNVTQQPAAARPSHHDVLERAIAEAHTESHHRRRQKRSRFAAAASVTAAMLLLVGFLSYQNLPYINMRVAAYKAGIEAKMPGYRPVGFNFGNLSYTPGNVTVSYYNQENGQASFDIEQQASEWNSKALLDNFVATTSKSYETTERAGRTIYLYGNNTATWVDNGIWYTIDGNDSLNSTQLLDIALSI